jgi:hypothetical protein
MIRKSSVVAEVEQIAPASRRPWASLHGRLFLSGTDGSNPVPSSGESCELSVPLSIPATKGLNFKSSGIRGMSVDSFF